jgi:tRNA threonylcarbamoyladenosine biosynthesis protein TsaE
MSPAETPALEFAPRTLAASEALAGQVALCARPGDVIALRGTLGAGKTAFARAFIRAREGGAAVTDVPSPTFTLVQVYDLPGGAVWHFDLYRLTNAGQAWELGLEEALIAGISLIEWPERLGALLPAERLDVLIGPGRDGDSRMVHLSGNGTWPARLATMAAHV